MGLDANRYSLVTAIFTVGGLLGSLSSSWLVQKKGLKGGLVYVAWMNVLGVALMGLSPSWIVLALGRYAIFILRNIQTTLLNVVTGL